MNLVDIVLKAGREKSVRQRHPWIFSGAISREPQKIIPGEIVRVLDSHKNFLGYGYHNLRSQIRIRLLDWDENAVIDDSWWYRKIEDSIRRRSDILESQETNACRLIYGEADFLPGLIVDKYAECLVVQVLTAGVEKSKNAIVKSLEKLLPAKCIYERSDAEPRSLEGIKTHNGILSGEMPADYVTFKENNHRFLVNIKTGQKTGFYLDQRDNRLAVASYAKELEVLDCFCFSGGFSVYALANLAKHVTLLDSSGPSLKLAKDNIKLNDFSDSRVTLMEGDVFRVLRDFRSEGSKFDMVILDPPKFAPTKFDLKKALSGYKDINMLAMSLLRPNGILATFSCSGAVDPQTLQTLLFWSGGDIGREVQILRSLSQGEDHPRLVTFPESEYLKGFICRVI